MGHEISQLDASRNLFEYHSVFATTLAIYLNLRKELDSNDGKSMSSTTASKRKEALSIIKSNLIYAIMLKRKDIENAEIPTDDYPKFIRWIEEQENSFRIAGMGENDVIDAMFAMMVRKQEVAGLTANSEKSMVSRMNMLINEVAREG